jgi:hypothetical protein
MRRPVLAALVLAVALTAPLAAQQAPQAQPTPDPPVSLTRIKRALSETRQVQSFDQFRLEYYVTVSAEAPTVDIFKDWDWRKGRAKGLPPTAKELWQQVTPQEFSAPVMDFTQIGVWLGSKIFHKKSGS